jgi:hypothetical protein
MAQNPSAIQIGPARIFTGVTKPATGTPPTLLTHTDGVPATGDEVGYTTGPATFTYKQVKNPIAAEQSLNPVDVYVTSEECALVFEAMERTYATLKLAFDNVSTVSDANKDLFYGGDSTGLSSVYTTCVVMTSRRRLATTKFEVLVIYKAYSVEGIQLGYTRTKESTYKVTMMALIDTTRDVGDRLFQWFREKTATGFSPSSTTSPSSSVSPSASVSLSPSASVSPS